MDLNYIILGFLISFIISFLTNNRLNDKSKTLVEPSLNNTSNLYIDDKGVCYKYYPKRIN